MQWNLQLYCREVLQLKQFKNSLKDMVLIKYVMKNVYQHQRKLKTKWRSWWTREEAWRRQYSLCTRRYWQICNPICWIFNCKFGFQRFWWRGWWGWQCFGWRWYYGRIFSDEFVSNKGTGDDQTRCVPVRARSSSYNTVIGKIKPKLYFPVGLCYVSTGSF